MSAEASTRRSTASNSETAVLVSYPVLEDFFLKTLEQLDGFCLDNEPERLQLATVLTQALISTARNGTINPIFLNEEQEAEGTS